MKILVTGAHGQLGTELCRLLDEKKITYTATGSAQLDITDSKQIDSFFAREQPEVVYDCAAFTVVDAAEEEPGRTINQAVNVQGTQNLAIAAEKIGATLVYVSTDYVFDGTNQADYLEGDTPNPRNEYGRAKLAGERAVQSTMTKAYIVRTSWVFGEYGKNFVYTMQNLAKTHRELNVVNDQVGRPTWTRTLAEFMLYCVNEKVAYGLYQLSNEGSCSWYEFACEILRDQNVKIKAVESTQFPQKAYRPRHSVMSLDKAEATGFQLMSWQDALHEFQEQIK
ncbi:dTDP-4-dehydrorhamnose reductase [Levilactobacillus koreensis JCM 16448]|uniref:dTDP-4-dehydrorhamnose reductase n=1 Tax=Levilactobacillus koreensis TaxID=637971 RepID=A0AAC8UX12_9LACO|nr:dTDP-4-dehydrorhamnose reductase [Levilactobacillus koreensis]AKP65334.1 dTDP-4-dehydrorhamnose reductase [Levilactobacillus koreensis]KRK86081.1 dTDP-4-dehydrorhamnose reductase [Levilactobacillus koreensis JCM 16448]